MGGTDFNDFLSLQTNFNQPGNWTQGDADNNGLVNFNDFLVLQTNFNKQLPPAAAPASGAVALGSPISKSVAGTGGVGAGKVAAAAPAALSTVSVAAALTGTPSVKYVLSKNDDGTGKLALGKYAVYAVDSTADGNKGMASFQFDLQGFTTVANRAPAATYEGGDQNPGNTVAEGFTLLPSGANVNPVHGSQDTTSAGTGSFLIYGLGQTGGSLDTAAATYNSGGGFGTQKTYFGPDATHVGLLLATGTFSGTALQWTPASVFDNGNAFVDTAGTNPIPYTVALQTQDLNNTPEPVALSLFALAGMGLLARRRRVNLVESTQQQRQA